MNTGFIGFGEAAFNIALGLLGEGVKGIRAYDAMENDPVMGKLVHKRRRGSSRSCFFAS